MKKFLIVVLSLILGTAYAQPDRDPGTLHNEVMEELLAGRYKGSGSLSGYIDAISQEKLGYKLEYDEAVLTKIQRASNPNDILATITNYKNEELLSSSMYEAVRAVIEHLKTWGDDEVSPELFDKQLDNFVRTLSVSDNEKESFSASISILKKSYEYQFNISEDNGAFTKNRCKGFWKKLCIIGVDFAAASIFNGLFGPGGGFVGAALYSAAASCCDICCPITQGCIDSQLCCITFLIGCNAP